VNLSSTPLIRHWINGQFVDATGGKTLGVIEPATARLHHYLTDGSNAEAELAVRAAANAFAAWANLPNATRAHWLRQIALGIEQKLEEFATAESMDCGKPIRAARNIDIPRAIENFRFFASLLDTYHSEAHLQAGALHYTLRQPLGPVLCISPWNLPLYLLSWKIAPALAFGNTVVAKPSEITPLSAHLLAQVCQEINLPEGVLNIVHGTGAGIAQALVTHPQVKAVSFTGSTSTGAHIATACAPSFRKTSLELGGKNATIVFADADFDMAVRESVRAAFSNQGQICLCGSRVLVEKSILPKFREAFIAAAKTLVPADPSLENTNFGALVSMAHMEKVLKAIDVAHAEGGRLLLGGERVTVPGRCEQGYFVGPTIFDQLPAHCETNTQEIFGPVCTLIPFDDAHQAIQIANSTRYGLAASVFTSDLTRAHRMSSLLKTGLVWINSWMQRDLRVPFGGVKDSGLGREGGLDAMRFFTEAKSVYLNYQS
jgi:aminomuconate-semialdehyde/2-hydroxymuconate-6-semialdehyde dehydrogenase